MMTAYHIMGFVTVMIAIPFWVFIRYVIEQCFDYTVEGEHNGSGILCVCAFLLSSPAIREDEPIAAMAMVFCLLLAVCISSMSYLAFKRKG